MENFKSKSPTSRHLGGGEDERQSLGLPSSILISLSRAVNEAERGVGVMLGVVSWL